MYSSIASTLFYALQSLATYAVFLGLIMLVGWSIRYLPAEKLKRNAIIVVFVAGILWLACAIGTTMTMGY
jgi:hypothetical protein